MNTSPQAETRRDKNRPISPGLVFADPVCLLGFGLGAGLSRTAPGTLGTLVAIPVYALMAQLSLLAYLTVVLTLFVMGIRICQHCEKRLGISDHSGIVWDEIVGYLVTLTAVPFSWPAAAAGFALFRLFDILKPWPIRLLDRKVHGGIGIMLDDLLAGIFAALCLQLLLPYLALAW